MHQTLLNHSCMGPIIVDTVMHSDCSTEANVYNDYIHNYIFTIIIRDIVLYYHVMNVYNNWTSHEKLVK